MEVPCGLMAEFENAQSLLRATRTARKAGYTHMDAFSPFPVEGLAEALDFHESRLIWFVLGGGLIGGLAGFGMQYYASVIAYPMNVGGKPFNSWPAFIPVSLEVAILTAAVVTVFSMLALNGLPMPYHPVFNVASFEQASQDRFFLYIEATDALFDIESTRKFLEGLNPLEVSNVAP